jgi:hypothetical protein
MANVSVGSRTPESPYPRHFRCSSNYVEERNRKFFELGRNACLQVSASALSVAGFVPLEVALLRPSGVQRAVKSPPSQLE